MTELQKRMIECLQLRGLSPRTQKAYLRAVRQLAEHYHKSPALITDEELRRYFLFLKNVKRYARPTMTIRDLRPQGLQPVEAGASTKFSACGAGVSVKPGA